MSSTETTYFSLYFVRKFVFYGCNKDDLQIDSDALNELTEWNTKTWKFVAASPAAKVAPGPYVYAEGQTWEPWRIYHTTYDFNAHVHAHIHAHIQAGSEFFKKIYLTLDAPQAGIDGRVIVPSRCYFKPSKSRPLEGARIVIKDNIDVAGHKTTLCNRLWQDLYPAKAENAACVQVLIDAGAIIVGKVKLQAMILREEPLEAVEFTAPFNPRGNGYQVPSGSSHASAAAIGSYDWLDFFFGFDNACLFDRAVNAYLLILR